MCWQETKGIYHEWQQWALWKAYMRQIRCADLPASQKEGEPVSAVQRAGCGSALLWKLSPHPLHSSFKPQFNPWALIHCSFCGSVNTAAYLYKNNINFHTFFFFFSMCHLCMCVFFCSVFVSFYQSLYLIELYNGSSHNMSDLSWSGCFGFFSSILPSVRNSEKQ